MPSCEDSIQQMYVCMVRYDDSSDNQPPTLEVECVYCLVKISNPWGFATMLAIVLLQNIFCTDVKHCSIIQNPIPDPNT